MGTLSAVFFGSQSREALVAEWLQDALQISCDCQPVHKEGGLVVIVVAGSVPAAQGDKPERRVLRLPFCRLEL